MKYEKINYKEILSVICTDVEYEKKGEHLAEHLGVDFGIKSEVENGSKLYLKYSEKGLTLTDGKLELRGDFSGMRRRLKTNNLYGELLVKAAGIKGRSNETLNVVDATAGLGEDSFLLAGAGYNVVMYESDPVIAALLKDAMHRAAGDPELSDVIQRMKLIEGDSIEGMKINRNKPDIIYLDPMFPERKKSSLVKKKFQLLHHLERPCDDEESLLNAAISASPMRIIIKRPLKGAFLGGKKPSYSLSGKAVRYDCIATGFINEQF